MFYQEAVDYRYENQTSAITGENLYFPVELDTEYTHIASLDNPNEKICVNITAQCRAIARERGRIYAYPEIGTLARHKRLETEFAVYDYLRDLGHEITPIEDGYEYLASDIPWLQIDVYAYFAVAEFPRVLFGKHRQQFLKILCDTNSRSGIEQGRRMRTFHLEGRNYLSWIVTPWFVLIDNYYYRIRLSICDTSAVQGNSNYKSFCSNSNVELSHKDNFTNEEKSRMLDMYTDRPDEFDDYALGDLYNYEALLGNAKNFEIVYKSLGISKYYTDPKFTIGSTISNLFSSTIKNLFNADNDDNDSINLFCRYASADYLKNLSTTGAINAKVHGGRCRNNRPIHSHQEGFICDIDIAGCYGDGLREQTYPLGIPSLLDYSRDTKINKYSTLRQFLKKYRKHFVPGLWQAIISLDDGVYLNNQQDYFASFILPVSMRNLATDDASHSTDKWWEIENIGESKIFKNQITNGVLTHDGLQWLENIASSKLKNELLDKLKVVTAMWYSKLDRVDSIDELLEGHRQHRGVNTTEIKHLKGRQRKVSIKEECHKWYGLNLGELIVNTLMKERVKYKKKTPLNTLYKLCVNTIYGDMVSPFFKIGNVIVGNNITARARALAWCMEKGFYGYQTITDGCAFNLNSVTHIKLGRKVGSMTYLHQYLPTDKLNLKYAPLPIIENEYNVEKYTLYQCDETFIIGKLFDGEEILYELEEFNHLVNKMAFVHLQKLFKGLDVLHAESTDIHGNIRIGQYQFEVKSFYEKATFHGSGNYYVNNGETSLHKMRSYQKGDKDIVVYDGKNLIIERGKSPAYLFLESLLHPESITRSDVYLKNRILKVNDYRNNYSAWSQKRVYPGVTVQEARLLREFSLGQFTFNTYEQYRSWLKQHTRLLKKYNQSYEMFYLNDDNTLNYQMMIEDIEKMIREGVMKYEYKLNNKQRHANRKFIEHLYSDTVEYTREQLDNMYRKRDDESE